MRHKSLRRLAVVLAVTLIVVGSGVGVYKAVSGSPSKPGFDLPSGAPSVTVSGNQLISHGKPIRLIGVVIAGSQYYCLGKHPSPFPMPLDGASVSALESWHVNAVKILLPETCWLGIEGEPRSTSSTDYRKSIESIVATLNAAHLEVILTMVAGVPNAKSTGHAPVLQKMADAAHGPEFWQSVASTFRNSPGVIFDMFGEPELITWQCWLNGCTIGGTKYAGMQSLIDAVRSTGAKQPIMSGGVDFSNDISGWLANEPSDPDHQLIADVHVYANEHCNNAKCWKTTIAATAKQVPVITGEFGDNSCAVPFLSKYMKWADKFNISYLAWGWIAGTCAQGGVLLTGYSGTSTAYGTAFKDHLDQLYDAGNGNVGALTTQKSK